MVMLNINGEMIQLVLFAEFFWFTAISSNFLTV